MIIQIIEVISTMFGTKFIPARHYKLGIYDNNGDEWPLYTSCKEKRIQLLTPLMTGLYGIINFLSYDSSTASPYKICIWNSDNLLLFDFYVKSLDEIQTPIYIFK